MEDRKWYSIGDIREEKKRCLSYIDQYTQYIDDWKQKREVENNNEEYRKLVDFCDEVIMQMEEIVNEFKRYKQALDVEYSKGYIRVKKGKYYYKKLRL